MRWGYGRLLVFLFILRVMDEKVMLVTSQASEKEVLQLVLGNSVGMFV